MVGRVVYIESGGGCGWGVVAANDYSSKGLRVVVRAVGGNPGVLGGLAVNYLDKRGGASRHIRYWQVLRHVVYIFIPMTVAAEYRIAKFSNVVYIFIIIYL
jgi:hypothetical protein